MAVRIALPILLGFALAASAARAELYRWTDANGVTHFTSDLNQVPAGQRDLARAAVSSGKGSLQRVASSAPRAQSASGSAAPASPAAPAAEDRVGGKTDVQWRDEATRLRSRIALFEAPAARCGKDRFAWSRGDGGRKYREEQAEAEACQRTELELSLARKALEDFKERARRTGVPPGWIRE
jgi:hypothetical protein